MTATGQSCSLKPLWFCLMRWRMSVHHKGHGFVLCGTFRGRAEGRPMCSSTRNALVPSDIVRLKLVSSGVMWALLSLCSPKESLFPSFSSQPGVILTAGFRGLLLGVCPFLATPLCAASPGISQPAASLSHADSPAQLKFLCKSFRLSLFLLGTMPPVGSVNTER